ncbi:MAG TPA: hypothetical protein VN193_15770 [Candidatus Angelobacter sp.]|jgi:hypothetical protein|nr:hypothetical protein [Candidatus Angelobacter sp.]
MSQPWVAQLPSAVPMRDFAGAASEAADDAAVCVFAPDDVVEPQDRRGYAALVIAYSRFEEPVTILDDGCTALLIRDGGLAAAAAACRRIVAQAARMGLESRLRVGLALVAGDPGMALRLARTNAAKGLPGEIAGAA